MITFDSDSSIGSFSRWTDEQKRRIHETSMRVLEEVGVKIYSDEALVLLRAAGAAIGEDHLVKISRRMVDKALETAPSSFSLYKGSGEKAFDLKPNVVTFGTGTDMPEFVDLYTGDFRPGCLKDCENAAKVAHQCKSIDWIAPYVLANDRDPRIADIYHFKAMRQYSDKPNLTLATDPYSLQGVIDMAAAQAGGYEALRDKPTFVHYAEPVSPLSNSAEALDKLLLCAEYGIPVTYTSGVIAGATGPVSLAGTLVVGNAECLTGLVAHQLKRQGAPFMYGCEASIMDMKTTVCMYGGPEYGLMNSFVGEMGRFYHLPSFGLSGATDANEVDFQMGAEMMYSMMTAIYGRQNFVHDNGYMGIGQMGSLQAIIGANELLTFVKRYAQDIAISEESLSFEAIMEEGPGGSFLEKKETFRKFRKEYYLPEFLNRYRNIAWAANGKERIADKFTQKAKAIVESESPEFIDAVMKDQFDEIIKEHAEFYRIES